MDEDSKFIAIEHRNPTSTLRLLICGLPRLLANESQTVKNTASKPMNYNKGIPFPSISVPCKPGFGKKINP
jgi:hypothetical protein